jgi:hypothetical protein
MDEAWSTFAQCWRALRYASPSSTIAFKAVPWPVAQPAHVHAPDDLRAEDITQFVRWTADRLLMRHGEFLAVFAWAWTKHCEALGLADRNAEEAVSVGLRIVEKHLANMLAEEGYVEFRLIFAFRAAALIAFD